MLVEKEEAPPTQPAAADDGEVSSRVAAGTAGAGSSSVVNIGGPFSLVSKPKPGPAAPAPPQLGSVQLLTPVRANKAMVESLGSSKVITEWCTDARLHESTGGESADGPAVSPSFPSPRLNSP